jgi:hypothetical protein
MHKNLIVDVLVVSMSWIIVCANCSFSLYTFPFTHSEDDDECGGDLTTNSWIFNRPSLSALFKSFSTSILLKKFASFSCLCFCSLLCAYFSLVIFCGFSMALFALMLLRTLELQKCTQLPIINTNYFRQLPFRLLLNIPPIAFIFLLAHCLLFDTWSSKLIQPIATSLCVSLYNHAKHFTSSLWMNATNFIFQLLHIVNLSLLYVLTPPCSTYIPIDYAYSFVDHDHTFVDYTNFFTNCANKYDDCANPFDDWTNIVVDLTNILDKSS